MAVPILTRFKLEVVYYTPTRNATDRVHIHVREAAAHVSTSTITPQREQCAS